MRSFRAGAPLVILFAISLVALFAPQIAGTGKWIPYAPDAVNLFERLQPPSEKHWLGTDEIGRDVASRIIHGSRVSLLVGLAASFLALLIGALLGASAGWFGGWVDWSISRLIEVILCFPLIFLLLAIVAFFGASVTTIIVAVGLSSWTTEARLIRAEVLKLKGIDFAEAARASGAGSFRIITRHLLPHAISPALVTSAFGVSSAIVAESAISFLGFGVPVPRASWGSILGGAEAFLLHAWWLAVFPGIAIVITVAACNALGEGLRDQLDPLSRATRGAIRRERQIARVA